MSENRGGDVLAAGAIRCQFAPAGGKVTQEQWDAIFEGFDPEKYRRNANVMETGVFSSGIRETVRS